jgi:hypothetical protein
MPSADLSDCTPFRLYSFHAVVSTSMQALDDFKIANGMLYKKSANTKVTSEMALE